MLANVLILMGVPVFSVLPYITYAIKQMQTTHKITRVWIALRTVTRANDR